MNERIRELAEQAGMSDDKFGMYFAKDKHDEDGVDLEKFAELIIKKCISQIALIGISNFENEDISWTVETAIDKIQEHFGVKNEIS